MLTGLGEADWSEAIDMAGAHVAVADYRPDWWPADTYCLIRRVRLDVAAGQVSADARSRRRRTLHPDQRALPLAELAAAEAVYAYSFILTNLEVSTPERAAAVEALVPAPHHHREPLPGQQTRRRAAVICPPATPKSTAPGCGVRCWPPPSPAGSTKPPAPSCPTTPWPDTVSATVRP